MEALTPLEWIIDAVLATLLLWLAWRTLACRDLFKAIVLFIAFGLLMALAWVRLKAPDIALAEAAIGAGLTGALMLGAMAKLRAFGLPRMAAAQHGRGAIRARWLPAVASLLVAAGLAQAFWRLPSEPSGLAAAVAANLSASGVANPVTAVLINFRGYDTLLETAVLFLALLGVWSLRAVAHPSEEAPGQVLDLLAGILAPVLILVAAYLLWVGADAPGGAFQAGSVLAAAAVLMLLAGWRLPDHLGGLPLRLLLVAGPAMFVVVAAATLLMVGRLLELPPRHAGTLILLLETTAMFSIAATLAALFLGAEPGAREGEARQ